MTGVQTCALPISGRVSIRHALNEYLANVGGHIGYCVLPLFRQRGVATAMLKSGIAVAHENGVNEILITCAEGNIGSQKVIESNGFPLKCSLTMMI